MSQINGRLLSIVVLVMVLNILAAANSAVTLKAVRLEQPLRLDAVLDEPFYQTEPFRDFIQNEPDNGAVPSERTAVWIGYDDVALYVGWRLWDSRPDSIVTRMCRRDADLNSDEIQVAIDSYNDNRSGFYFIVNPSGSVLDGAISNDGWFDDNWDGIWSQKARIDEQGWTVEMRIPFSQLRFNMRDEIVMGLGLGRIIKRKNEQILSFLEPRGESGLVSRFGDLAGIRDLQPPRRIELTPYTTASYADLPSEADNPFYHGYDRNTGLGTDLKFGIGNNLTVDATINPDFGQVEVDPSVINLSDYETYYDEKRPFFVEGSSIFSFGSGGSTNQSNFNYSAPDFFYSRRVGRPPQRDVDSDGWVDTPSAAKILGAAKISGKLPGDLSIGGLTALTRREFVIIDDDTPVDKIEVEPQTSYNLLRLQKEINGGRHGIGGLATHLARQFDDQDLQATVADNATGLGIDGWTFFNEERRWALSGWAGYTRVNGSPERLVDLQEAYNHYFQKPDVDYVSVDSGLTSLEGWAGRLFLNKEKGQVRVNASLGVTSPGFESNDMGINFRTDQINKHFLLGYAWFEPGSWYRSATIWAAAMNNHNFGGDKINQMIFLSADLQLLNYTGFWFIAGGGPRTLDDTKLRGGPLVGSPAGYWGEGGYYSDGRKDLSFDVDIEASAGENGYWYYDLSPSLNIKLGTQLNFNLNPEYSVSHTIAQYVMSIDDPAADYMYGTRYIFAVLDRRTFETNLRMEYTFTPRLTFQAYFQALLAVGEYSDYKEFARPRSLDYRHYAEEGLVIRYDEPNDEYYVEDTGQYEPHEIDDDFNYKSLVGSAVLRWEFRPGSILYLVWTSNGVNEDHPGDFRLGRDLNDLWRAENDDVLALKLTWWIGR
ncbi:MAG: DUF5916 domain-containing protein [Candidatus Neomarinimicrobiota bacterium]